MTKVGDGYGHCDHYAADNDHVCNVEQIAWNMFSSCTNIKNFSLWFSFLKIMFEMSPLNMGELPFSLVIVPVFISLAFLKGRWRLSKSDLIISVLVGANTTVCSS